MKTKTSIILMFLIMALILAACGDGKKTAEPADTEIAVEEPTAEPAAQEAQPAPSTEAVEPTEEEVAQEEAAQAV